VFIFEKIYLGQDLINEILSWRISYYDTKCSTDNVISLFISFVAIHAPNTHKLNVPVAHLT